MTTFNHAFDTALQCIELWGKKNLLSEVTMVRDVYGRISFLMNNIEAVAISDQQELIDRLEQDMGPYFSGKIYWKKLSHRLKKIEEREKMIVELIEQGRMYWKENENILFFISERAIAKKAWIYKRNDYESVWPYEEAVLENGTKIVTFYSFKGGMGRTTALAGVALTLAEQGKNVLMIDTDIEAPGLATLFFDEEIITGGVLDYFIDRGIDSRIDVTAYVLDVIDSSLLDENAGRLFLMPSGKVDENYLQKLARIDYQDHRDGYLRESLAALLTGLKDCYQVDYILMDAGAGFHEMGGIAITQLPHGVVLFGNDSRQSWDGMTHVLRTIAESHTEDFPIMLVDSMCPDPAASDFATARQRFIHKAYTVCMENYYNTDSGIPGIEAEGESHFPEFISFDHVLLQGVELFSDGSQERNLRVNAYKNILTGECYKKIAARIKGWFGDE